ncbi:hypothetical protein A2U01_0014151, partial [Trifolium medium]|nr:hypothetical protein [Trifolium medium]
FENKTRLWNEEVVARKNACETLPRRFWTSRPDTDLLSQSSNEAIAGCSRRKLIVAEVS